MWNELTVEVLGPPIQSTTCSDGVEQSSSPDYCTCFQPHNAGNADHGQQLCFPGPGPSIHSELVGADALSSFHGHRWVSMASSLTQAYCLQSPGMGIKISTIPIFSAEVSPAPIRGGIVTSFQLWVAFGMFVYVFALRIYQDINEFSDKLRPSGYCSNLYSIVLAV